MGHMLKVAVYAIAKNEEANAAEWFENMKRADGVFVLVNDTQDRTAEILSDLGATVKALSLEECLEFDAFFESDGNHYPNNGVLRNAALDMIPRDYDIFVPVDLDDRWRCDDWVDHLRQAWSEGSGLCCYKYVYDCEQNVSYTHDRIHSRNGWLWTGYAHEWLTGPASKRNAVRLPDDVYQYAAGPHRNGDLCLPQLRKQAADMPDDARTAHYYGRQLMYEYHLNEAIAELKRHLSLPTATWGAERAASCRYISSCYQRLDNATAAWEWANKAVAEDDTLREPWIEAMRCCALLGNPHGVIFYGRGALAIEKHSGDYIMDAVAWGSYPHECLAWAYTRLGDKDNAIKCLCQAALISTKDDGNVQELIKALDIGRTYNG
jgi:tetratricopeptide (TPR) repeat protein